MSVRIWYSKASKGKGLQHYRTTKLQYEPNLTRRYEAP